MILYLTILIYAYSYHILLVRVSVRLKGCEGEVAAYLDTRWKLVTYDWENYDDGDLPLDERQAMAVEDD